MNGIRGLIREGRLPVHPRKTLYLTKTVAVNAVGTAACQIDVPNGSWCVDAIQVMAVELTNVRGYGTTYALRSGQRVQLCEEVVFFDGLNRWHTSFPHLIVNGNESDAVGLDVVDAAMPNHFILTVFLSEEEEIP